jgi:hypothetical protein
MNELRLEVYRVEGWSFPVVRVLIDAVDLVALARTIERPFADAEGHPDIAGGYGGLSVSDVAAPSRRLWGEYACYGDHGEKVALLGCGGCGEEGCWPLAARIDRSNDTVTWSAFEQPHRPEWDLSALGPFVFDRHQYEAAISALGDARHV